MHLFLLLFALIVSSAALAHSHSLADLEIVDRSSGAVLAVHPHNGRAYVVGHPKREYEIRIRNRSPHRLLAVTSTGHGSRDHSPARYVRFERAAHPDERLVLYYDSERNLSAQGVLPRKPRHRRDPNPFPNAFAPDP